MLSVPVLVVIVIIVLYVISIKILGEYERGVVFRLGACMATPKGPGLILVFRPLDQMVRDIAAAGSDGSAAAGRDHAR